MTLPTFLSVFASPFLSPNATGNNSVNLVSIQYTVATFLSGYRNNTPR